MRAEGSWLEQRLYDLKVGRSPVFHLGTSPDGRWPILCAMNPRPPNHADAELVLKLYDLRREAVMRASRKTLMTWVPTSYADLLALTKLEHEDNAAWRQVTSFYEYAFGFGRHGIVPPDFLAEYNGEGLLLFAKVEPFLAQMRAELAPTAFINSEWIVQNSHWARERLALLRVRVEKMRAAAAEAPRKAARKAPARKSAARKQAGRKSR